MSHADTAPLRRPDDVGTVTPSYLGRPDAEMDVVGWIIFLGLLVVLFPLIPVLLVLLAVSKVAGFVRQQTR